MILADTDVLIDFLAATPAIADQVKAYVESDTLQTSAISCFELLSGAREGKRGDNVRRLVAAIPVLPLDRQAATAAADVRHELERNGLSIGMADSLIAGVALTNGIPLLTRNRKHFERVHGLQLVPVSEAKA